MAASIKDPARALRITLVYLQFFLPTTVLVCAQQNPLSEKCTSSRAHTAHIYSSGLSDTAGKSQIRPPAPSFKSTFCSDDIPWDPSSDCCVTGMSSEAAPVTLQIRALHRPSTARDNARSEYCTSAKERLLYLFITGIWYSSVQGFRVISDAGGFATSNSEPVFLRKIQVLARVCAPQVNRDELRGDVLLQWASPGRC